MAASIFTTLFFTAFLIAYTPGILLLLLLLTLILILILTPGYFTYLICFLFDFNSSESISSISSILQQVSPPSVASNPTRCRKTHSCPRRLQPPTKQSLFPPSPTTVVRPFLGPSRLHLRRIRPRPLCHRRLRWISLLQRHRRNPTSHTS